MAARRHALIRVAPHAGVEETYMRTHAATRPRSSFTLSYSDYADICASPDTPGRARVQEEYARPGRICASFDNRMTSTDAARKADTDPCP